MSDPGTWTTFEEALAAHRLGRFDGVGFILGLAEEDDTTYVGLDLDDCRDPETGAGPGVGHRPPPSAEHLRGGVAVGKRD